MDGRYIYKLAYGHGIITFIVLNSSIILHVKVNPGYLLTILSNKVNCKMPTSHIEQKRNERPKRTGTS